MGLRQLGRLVKELFEVDMGLLVVLGRSHVESLVPAAFCRIHFVVLVEVRSI